MSVSYSPQHHKNLLVVYFDHLVLIDEIEYEVNYRYSKQKITLRYSPDMSKVFIIEPHTGDLSPIRLLNKHENLNIKREKVQLTGGNI